MRAPIRTGVSTEYAGNGRVRFIHFGAGAGYVTVLRRGRGRDGKPLETPGWRPNIVIPGWTLYIRLTPTSRKRPSHVAPKHFPTLRRVLLTRSGNVNLWCH